MNKTSDLPIIKMLWIGKSLSLIEQLSLKSFMFNLHEVQLFCYEKIDNVPQGVTIRDANEILPSTSIFRYKKENSVAGFANWFRYELLFKEGGIWADADVVCLKPINIKTDLIFGKEDSFNYNNAVLGGTSGHPLFKWMAQQASSPNNILPYDTAKIKRMKFKRRFLQGNKIGNVVWGEAGPKGLTKAIKHLNLEEYALPTTAFYPIHYQSWDTIFDNTFSNVESYFPDSYAIHIWNEMLKTKKGFDKNSKFDENSLIEYLKKKYL